MPDPNVEYFCGAYYTYLTLSSPFLPIIQIFYAYVSPKLKLHGAWDCLIQLWTLHGVLHLYVQWMLCVTFFSHSTLQINAGMSQPECDTQFVTSGKIRDDQQNGRHIRHFQKLMKKCLLWKLCMDFKIFDTKIKSFTFFLLYNFSKTKQYQVGL